MIVSIVVPLSGQTTQHGELSLFVLNEGKPLVSEATIFSVDGKSEMNYKSDNDGYIFAILEEGQHKVELFAKENGVMQSYLRKFVIIKKRKQSQIIVSLNKDNSLSLVDEELPIIQNNEQKSEDNTSKKELTFGILNGLILSSDDKSPVVGARIFVRGSSVEGLSDKEGKFSLKIASGAQAISIIHSNFSAQTIKVSITQDTTTQKEITLSPASLEMEEFVVLAPHVSGSVAAVIAEEKNSESIANIVGSEQMSKQGDSDAASALKRVAGITIVRGKYIYVRGLGDRYSATEMNSMPLPSPNPIKRTIPLDLFPSGVIGSLQVQKTFSPDITGAFGGGYVNVRTKEADEDYIKIKLGMNQHSSTGSRIITSIGSNTDYLGVDSGFRSFDQAFINSVTPVVGQEPPAISNTPQEMQAMLQKRSINRRISQVPYGGEMAVEVAKTFEIDDEQTFTVLANYGYKQESSLRQYTDYDYLLSADGIQDPNPDNTATTDLYRNTIKHGGLLNLGYSYNDFKINYTKLYVLNTLNQSRDIDGTFGENNSIEHGTYFEWQERELNVDQIHGTSKYHLVVDNDFSFGAELATAREFVPNDVFYDYKKRFPTQPYEFLKNQSKLTFNNRTTDDDLFNINFKNKAYIPMLSDDDYIEAGYTLENKDREGRRNELTIQSGIKDKEVAQGQINGIINYSDGSDLDYSLTSQAKDQYNANLNRNALYFKSLVKPQDDISIVFGVRYVDLKQSVEQFKVEQNLVTIENSALNFTKTLPSASLKYSIDDDNQLRFAYTETFVYPDFREFINSEFIHPVFLAKVAGNPDLVETDIQSYDIRYDHYFNKLDSINMSLFYKHMDNPIEDTTEFTTSTLDKFSFDNAKAADLMGIELSFAKNLEFVSHYLDRVSFSGNYTYLQSEISLTAEQKNKYVTQERGLQGLSPEVINLSLTYNETDVRTVNLSYNKMSERLMRVALKNGDVVLGLDDYEVPPQLLDFTWIEKFHSDTLESDMDLTVKVKNLLDGETVWKQGELTTLKYKTGTSFSMTLNAKF